MNPEEKLSTLLQRDLQTLRTSKKLPANWNSIRSIEMAENNDLSEHWLKSITVPLELNPQGKHHLEVLVLPWLKDEKYGAAINFYLIEISSGATVAEFGRTFVVGDEAELSDRKLLQEKSEKTSSQ